jgi:hypothetical protein
VNTQNVGSQILSRCAVCTSRQRLDDTMHNLQMCEFWKRVIQLKFERRTEKSQ